MKLAITRLKKIETYTVRGVSLIGGAENNRHVCSIIFEDNKFKECQFNATNPYTREEWMMLSLIEKLISRIESDARANE